MYRLSIVLLLFLSTLLLSRCQKEKKAPHENHEGLALLKQKCYSCHNPTASMDARLAPPMAAIKKHYIKGGTSKGEFTEAFVRFVQNPSEETSKMPGAVERFGVMPKMNYSKEELSLMADYIYDTEIETPAWFEKHYEEEHVKKKNNAGDPSSSFLEDSRQKALKTKSVLGKNLMRALNEGGPAHALSFCTTRAIPLTDSMSQVQQWNIQRVSDRPRNHQNKATGAALEYIQLAKSELEKGNKLTGSVDTINGTPTAFIPIMTNEMCMNCHAAREELAPELIAALDEHYPTDKAVGYLPNQLRGVWVVSPIHKE